MLKRLTLFIVVLLSCQTHAQWSDDPAQNLLIASGTGEQVLCKIGVRSDGGSYVGWFSNVGAPNNYEVRLQRLAPNGQLVWAQEGILISDLPHESFLVDWDLIADSSNHAVLTFTDNRAGNRDVQAYRIDENGTFLWGATGISLSTNTSFEADPRVTENSDGDFVFVWSRSPSVGDGSIVMQRITPGGDLQLPAGGLSVATGPGESPGFCEVVPSLNGDVIVSWLRDLSFSSSVRHILVQRFNVAGTAIWNGGSPVTLFNLGLPAGYRPRLVPDDEGGAASAWFFGLAELNCYVQRVDSAGTLAFPANGLTVSEQLGQQRMAPSIAFNGPGDNLFVFWRETNLNQNEWGLYGNSISATGIRDWGNNGLAFIPVGQQPISFVNTHAYNNQAQVFWFQTPSPVSSVEQVKGMAVDANGDPVWENAPIEVASSLASKDNLETGLDLSGRALLVWDDERNGPSEVYGQNVNNDGSLGPDGVICPGDCSPPGGDGVVDEEDLLAAVGDWPGVSVCDFDGNQEMNMLDLVEILSAFGSCPTR